MASIFLSYSRADRAFAGKVVDALETGGCTVWWDSLIEGGERFSKTTEAALNDADVVVVLWSRTSVQSHWVHDEAGRGRDRGRLVPASIDGSAPPLGFGQFQALDLGKWKGRADAAEIASLLRAIALCMGQPEAAPSPAAVRRSGLSRRTLVVGSGAALALAGGGFAAWTSGLISPRGKANSVAVLPFRNLSGDPGQDYFAEGLAEEIRESLSREPLLQVAGSASSVSFKGKAEAVQSIAGSLGVAFVLDGSVRRADNMVRIAARLVNGLDGFTIWSRTFDRAFNDLLALQSEIAGAIRDVLTEQARGTGVNDDSAERRRAGGTVNAAAFDAYTLGRAEAYRFSGSADFEAARSHFETAITLDPSYAAAHAALAVTLHLLIDSGQGVEVRRRMLELADKHSLLATKLAPEAPHPHSARAIVMTTLLRLGEARDHAEKALKLGQGWASTLVNAGLSLGQSGRLDAASQALDRAVKLDSLSANAWFAQAWVRYWSRHYEPAIASATKGIAVNPKWMGGAMGIEFVCRLQMQQFEKALDLAARLEDPEWYRALVQCRTGNVDEAQGHLTKMERRKDRDLYSEAILLAQIGNTGEAIIRLTELYQATSPMIADLVVEPLLDPLRREQGFRALISQMGVEN